MDVPSEAPRQAAPQPQGSHVVPWVVLAAVVIVVGIAWYAYSAGMFGAAKSQELVVFGALGNPPVANLYAYTPGSHLQTPLVPFPPDGQVANGTLSPDGSMFAETVHTIDGTDALLLAPLSGSVTGIASTSLSGSFMGLTWSPGSRKLAYITLEPSGPGQAVHTGTTTEAASSSPTRYATLSIADTAGGVPVAYRLFAYPLAFSGSGSQLLVRYGPWYSILSSDGSTATSSMTKASGMPSGSPYRSVSSSLDGSHLAVVTNSGEVIVGTFDWQTGAYTGTSTVAAGAKKAFWQGSDLMVYTGATLETYGYSGTTLSRTASVDVSLPSGTDVFGWTK